MVTETTWSLAPYLRVDNAAKAIEFYVNALGAKEIARYPMEDGTIAHAELNLHGNKLCLADSDFTGSARNPADTHRVPVMLYAMVPDVDAVYARAIAAGAKSDRPPTDQTYGERSAGFIDPFGHVWYVSKPIP
ncbi:MAG: VOC family protein [Vulcanimicrobiaceae bacterium]